MCFDDDNHDVSICLDCGSSSIVSAYIRSPKYNNFITPVTDWYAPSDLYYVILRCGDCGSVFLSPCYFEESASLYSDERYFNEYFPNNIHTGGGPKLETVRFEFYSRWINKRQAKQFLSMANLPLNMATRIVDLGCAKGDLVLGFTDCGCDACGIDISEQMVQAAQTKGINVVRGRFEDIEIPANSIDLITSIEVYEHMSDLEAVLAKVKQVLKPDGVLIIQVPNDIDGYRRYIFRKIWWMIPPMHIRYFTYQSIENIFGRHGFRISKINTYGSVGADIGRIVTWFFKQRGLGGITRKMAYRIGMKILSAMFIPIDGVLNILKRHSEMVIIMKKSECEFNRAGF
jgi:2-polyprenyl-3-methyl-5-hydroxy-6-metoxy-1,4-benzoquinol methylase